MEFAILRANQGTAPLFGLIKSRRLTRGHLPLSVTKVAQDHGVTCHLGMTALHATLW